MPCIFKKLTFTTIIALWVISSSIKSKKYNLVPLRKIKRVFHDARHVQHGVFCKPADIKTTTINLLRTIKGLLLS